jgi:CRP-like cAMP-binding protein
MNMIAIMSDLLEAFTQMREREHSLGDGGMLFRTGDPVQWVYGVTEGSIHLVRNLPHGTTLTLQVAGAGVVLAEASLFSEAYHCDAIAVGPARLLAVSRPVVEDAVTRDPTIARLWAKHLASEIQRTRAKMEIVSLKTVAERLNAYLGLGGKIPPRGQFRRLASELNVSPEAPHRELASRR